MTDTFDQNDIENIQLDSLADLDILVSEKFDIPLQSYSTDIRAALELVAWDLENSNAPHFEMFRTENHSLPGLPFIASFEPAPEVWGYGETAALAICQAALFRHKRIKFTLLPKSEMPSNP